MKLYKFSDYMRLGSTFRPKISYYLYDGKGSCALGAAYEGFNVFHKMPLHGTWGNHPALDYHVWEKFRHLYVLWKRCPMCSHYGDVPQLIAHLNNGGPNDTLNHGLSREAVAHWVEWNFEDGRNRIKGEILCLDQLPDYMDMYCPRKRTRKRHRVSV